MPADTKGKGPGRPPHEPTDDQRAIAARMTAEARPAAAIAKAIGISVPTLRHHYAVELVEARPQVSFPFPASDAGDAQAKVRPGAGGRPMHEPTAESREDVEILVASGMSGRQIAQALGISEPTLRLHYENELATGGARKLAAMNKALFTAGVGGNVAAMKAFRDTFRLNVPGAAVEENNEPAGPKLGKKEQALANARSPDTGSTLGALMARRAGLMN